MWPAALSALRTLTLVSQLGGPGEERRATERLCAERGLEIEYRDDGLSHSIQWEEFVLYPW